MPPTYNPTRTDRIIWYNISSACGDVYTRLQSLQQKEVNLRNNSEYQSPEDVALELKKLQEAIGVLKRVFDTLCNAEGM